MPLEIGAVGPDDFAAYTRQVSAAFGYSRGGPVDVELGLTELDRIVAARDGSTIVGTSEMMSFDITVPGGATVPAGGLAKVGVATTHRRQGILRSMMAGLLQQCVDRNEPLAILYASEAGIYGRFGFGAATTHATLTIDSSRAELSEPVALSGLRRLEDGEAGAVLGPLHDTIRRGRAGLLSRPQAWTDHLVGPARSYRGGGSPFVIVHENESGRADGFAVYQIRHGQSRYGSVEVRELVAMDAHVEAQLWQYCLAIDLTRTVVASYRPLSDPFPLRLVDYRDASWSDVSDGLWVRIVNLADALIRRRYERDGVLVLDVTDSSIPSNGGRWLLDVIDGTAMVTRTEADADVAVDIAALGTVYLGGVPLRTLAAAGRVSEVSPGAVDRADGLFRTAVDPWCSTHF